MPRWTIDPLLGPGDANVPLVMSNESRGSKSNRGMRRRTGPDGAIGGSIDGLETEPAAETRTVENMLREQLRNNDATDEEIALLLTERVEINAMGSAELVQFNEDKLEQNGICKVIPNRKLLEEAYREFDRGIQLKKVFEAAEKSLNASAAEVPKDLEDKVREVLDDHDDLRWDQAVQVVRDPTLLDYVRKQQKEEKAKAGNFVESEEAPA